MTGIWHLYCINFKLIVACHNSAVVAYLVAFCKINAIPFIASNKTFIFHFLQFWVSSCFCLGWGKKGVCGRKFWNLNNSRALQQAKRGLRLAQASTRGAAWLGGDRIMEPALPYALVSRMVTGMVQLVGLLLKEWGKGWKGAGIVSVTSFGEPSAFQMSMFCLSCICQKLVGSLLGKGGDRNKTSLFLLLEYSRHCTSWHDAMFPRACFCKLWQPLRSVHAGVLLASIATTWIQCRQGSLGQHQQPRLSQHLAVGTK